MKAKICGITNQEDALFAAQHGAWALGFNFYHKSLRYIEKEIAKEIIASLPASVIKVGLFIDKPYDYIASYVDDIGLDLVQIYAPINASATFKEKVIFAIQEEPIKNLDDYGYLLIDAPKNKDGLMGGTGRIANWTLASKLAQDYRLILAGGLNPNNIEMAINKVAPYAVDVASGVESKPGVKDDQLVINFLKGCSYDK